MKILNIRKELPATLKRGSKIIKLIATALSVCLVFGAVALAGCGGTDGKKDDTGIQLPQPEDKNEPEEVPDVEEPEAPDIPEPPAKTKEDVIKVLNAAIAAVEAERNYSLILTQLDGKVITVHSNRNIVSASTADKTIYYEETEEGNFIYEQNEDGVWEKRESENDISSIYLQVFEAVNGVRWTSYKAETNKLTGSYLGQRAEVVYENDETESLKDDIIKVSINSLLYNLNVQIYDITNTQEISLPEIIPSTEEDNTTPATGGLF